MKKEVKSIEDLEIGMFIKDSNSIRVILKISDDTIKTAIYSDCVLDNYIVNVFSKNDFERIIMSWSYTFKGVYTPVIKKPVPTAEQLKIKELEKSIENAHRQIAFASKQMEELKELRK